MKITEEHIVKITEDLEVGMKVFINRKNLEIRSILDWEDSFGDDELWEEEYNKIEKEWSDFVTIEKMESRDSFRIMEKFIPEVDDEVLQTNLITILERKSPFANFKVEIESSPYRQNWFDFRKKMIQEYVKQELEFEGFEV